MQIHYFIMLLFLVAAGFELGLLWKRGRRRELWASASLFAVALGLHAVLALQLEVPNPVDWLFIIFGPVSELIDRILGV